MKQKLLLLTFALFTTIGGAWATEVTTVATAGSYLTLDQLKALSGTGGHVAFANVGSGNWTNKWLANPSANSNLTLSTVQLYTITDGSVSGKYYMQRVSDSQYRTGSGWGDLASAENIEFRAYTNSATTVACTDPISIHNNSGTQWNINAGSFGGALNAWAAYAAYGPFYILKVTCIDDETSTTLQTSTQIVTNGHTMDIPTYAGKKLVDGSPASIAINGADAVYELHYVSSSFEYTLVVNGAVEGMTMTINGDAITSGQTAYSSAAEVVAEDVVVTFPSEYSYMTAKVTISGTTITVNCEDTRWPINFDKSQTFTRSDRHINSASFNDQIVDGLYVNTSTTCYQDLTATKKVKFPPSTSVKPSFAMTGAWQHGFVYIDLNNDGDFTDEGELVSKVNEGNPDLSTAIPAFTSPAAVGTYRLRIKSDWSSEDPGGNEGAEPGNIDGNNHIIKNGGMIVDIKLEISEDYSDILTAITKPFTDYPAATGYFRMTSDNATSFLGMVNTASSNDGIIDADEYAALLEYFKGFVRFPDTGCYLIKNSSSNNYLAYGTPGESGKAVGLITTEGNPTPANIIRLTKVGFNEYTISSQGLNVQARKGANNTFPMSDSEGVVFSFVPLDASNLKITNTDSYVDNYSPGSLFEVHWTKPYAVVNWEPSGAQGQWTIEAAEDVTISLTAANDNTSAAHTYATLCVPFEITGLTGADAKEVKAYTPTKEDNAIVPGEGASTVAAGTPVILIGEEGATSVTATIGSGYAATPATTNILTGTFTGTSIDCTAATGANFVLGFDINNDNRIGFYHVDNASFNLKANRAYLHSEGSGVKGFVIDFNDNATGIETMVNGQSSMVNEIFNLAGQRLQKAQKGINIINGKKILK